MTAKANSHWPVSILSSASALLNMFIPLVMARLLLPDDIGKFRIFYLYVAMGPLFSLTGGLFSGLGFWAGQGARGDRAIRTSNAFILMAALAVSLLCLAGSPLIASRFHWPLRYAVYFSGAIFSAISLNFLEESWIAKGRVWNGAIYMSGTEVIRALVTVLVAWFTRDLGSILLACAIVAVTKVLVSVWLGKRTGVVGFEIDRDVVRAIWRYSFPVSLAALFSMFTATGDQLVLSNIISPAAFAFYSIGCLTIAPLFILEQSVIRVMIPQLSAAFASGNSRTASKHYSLAVEQLAWILVPAVVGLIVFAKPIIELLFTVRYSAASGYLRWYALLYLTMAFPNDAVPRARGEGHWILKNFMIFAPIAMVLCYLLGKKFGPFGALAGLLISQLSMRLYALYYVHSSSGWKFKDFVPFEKIAIFTSVSLPLGFLCSVLGPALNGGLKWFLSCGLLFVVLYFPFVLLLVNWRDRTRPRVAGEKRRVLMFSQHLGVGGLERLILSLSRTLQQNENWEVFLYSHDSDENAQSYTDRTLVGEFLAAGIPVDAFKKGRGLSIASLFRLIRNIYRNRIEVVHSHDLGTLIYAVLAKIMTLGRFRLVHTQHSFVHIHSHKRYSLYERIFTSFVDSLTVVNETMVEAYVSLGVPRERVRIIPNGAVFAASPLPDRAAKLEKRPALIRQLPSGENAELESRVSDSWLLYLARLQPVKGQREAAEVWRCLSPDVRRKSVLFLVGPEAESGELNSLLQAFSNVPDRDRVIFVGGSKTPQEWLAASDLFISCSKQEGMPLGPMEAIGSGLPAVLSAIEGHRFLEKAVRQYPLGAPAQGAGEIEEALKDAAFGSGEYYARFWKNGEWIRQQYSLDAMTRKYVKLYEG